jgi:hypothetical protein
MRAPVGQQIIMVVGPDMCGKTEISTTLSKVLGIPRFKASTEHDTYLKGQSHFIQQLRYADPRMIDFLQQTGYSAIFDRAYPCEYAYARVLGRETDPVALATSDEWMAELGARVIICRRSSYAGIVDDIDPTTKEERLWALDDAYREFSEWTKCRTLVLNVDDENLQREIHDILQWMGLS